MDSIPRRRHGYLSHPIATAALGVAAVIVAYQLLSGALFWVQLRLDDLRYGYPRTTQMDAYVGFGESSGLPTHFIALNLHRQIVVIYLSGDDPTRPHVLKGPYLYGPDQEYAPVALRVADVTGDGYPDLVVTVDHERTVFVDVPSKAEFRSLLPAESAAVDRILGPAQ